MMQNSLEQQVESIVREVVERVLENQHLKSGRRQLIIANWKMNMTLEKATEFIQQLSISDDSSGNVVVCPPYTLLYPMNHLLQEENKAVSLGAQNLHTRDKGAHTGEVSALMLKESGCQYVIVGHSERRAAGETDNMIHKKIKRALEVGIEPIVCVGETIEQRKQGHTHTVVNSQLMRALGNIQDFENIVIAYEPVWAIGTGESATPEAAQAVHEGIRHTLHTAFGKVAEEIPILYGGSVKPENAGVLSNMKDIDGFLVGGASLQAEDFQGIIESFRKEMST